MQYQWSGLEDNSSLIQIAKINLKGLMNKVTIW